VLDLACATTAAAVLGLQRTAYAVEAEIVGHEGIPPLTESLEQLRQAGLTWLGTTVEGQLVAALAYSRPDPGLLDIERLVVHLDHFRRGHARALLAAMPPSPVTVVSTGRDNTPARTLYLGLGFRPIEDAEVVPGLWVTRFRRDAPAISAADPCPAEQADAHDLWLLRRQLEDWICARGIDQWRPGEVAEQTISRQITAGEWHVHRRNGILVAALRLLWSTRGSGGDDGDAVYVHGLMVDRRHAGHRIGERLLAWAGEQARAAGRSWLRLDCAAGNTTLCDYYRSCGFTPVRTQNLPDGLFDVVLWQRPAYTNTPKACRQVSR
jgi:GNAT superfamily N-acetyltransferase